MSVRSDRSPAEAVGRDAFDLVVPPEVRDRVRRLLRQMRDQPRASVDQRNENLTRNGRRILCDWVDTPLFDETDRFSGFVSIAQDVTGKVRIEDGLRASEERYRSIFETTREGVWTGDLEGRTTFANAQLAEMLGSSVGASSWMSRSSISMRGSPRAKRLRCRSCTRVRT